MTKTEKDKEKVQPMTAHIAELRKLLIYSIVTMLAGAVICYSIFGQDIMKLFTWPLTKLDLDLVYINVSEAFTTQLKVTFLLGIILTSPLVMYFIWRFISPALFPKEKKSVLIILPSAILLFAVGVAFSYFIVLQYALKFFLVTTAGSLTPMLSVNQYVKFLYNFLLPFGLAFELPLVVHFLVKLGIVSVEKLVKVRKYVLFGIVVIAAVITPPDVISQIAIAVPMYMLYEVSIFLSRGTERRRLQKLEKGEANVRE